LFDTIPAVKKDILWYPEAWHEIWLEPVWEKMMNDVLKLLPKYIPTEEEIK